MNGKLIKWCVLLIFLISIICNISCSNDNDDTLSLTSANSDSENNQEEKKTLEPTECSIVAAGDLVMHMPVVDSAYNSASKSYDFHYTFRKVKSYIEGADYAMCNSETSYLNDAYTGYPCFNSPASLLDTLKNVGFDCLSSAHNHSLDKRVNGINATIKTITEKGFDLIGLQNSGEDKDYIIRDIKGIKVGFTQYTYATTDSSGNETLNGIPIPKEVDNRINYFDFSKLDRDLSKMKSTIEAMKSDGAEFIIFNMHWGNEYQISPCKEQETVAKALNSYGVDVIFGSHPHVVEPVRTITDASSNKKTLVCYSLGNFISNQSQETIGQARSEDGLMVKLNLYKDEDGVISLKSYETKPTWVYKSQDTGKLTYEILPTKDIIDSGEVKNYSKAVFNSVTESYNATEKITNS